MHILVVDDDPVIRRLVAHTLVDDGYEVHTACDGQEALDLVPDVAPAAIILDLEMPRLDGRATFRELRARGYEIPVMILSAFGATQARHELGAEAAMDKPFDPFELLRRLKRLATAAP